MNAFRWKVASRGYEWRLDRRTMSIAGTEVVLSEELLLEPAGQRFREYEPLAVGGLFGTFAMTAPTPDGVKAFADHFGSIGATISHAMPVANPHPEARPGGAEYSYTTTTGPVGLSAWVRAIAEMREAVELWQRVTDRQAAGDLRNLTDLLDGQLARLRVAVGFTLEPAPTQADMSPSIQLVPATLGGCLWVQFAQAVAGRKAFRACAVCGRWFDRKERNRRATRVYCSPGCNYRAYRARKEQAVALATAGKTSHEIAAELGRPADHVARWVGAKDGVGGRRTGKRGRGNGRVHRDVE